MRLHWGWVATCAVLVALLATSGCSSSLVPGASEEAHPRSLATDGSAAQTDGLADSQATMDAALTTDDTDEAAPGGSTTHPGATDESAGALTPAALPQGAPSEGEDVAASVAQGDRAQGAHLASLVMTASARSWIETATPTIAAAQPTDVPPTALPTATPTATATRTLWPTPVVPTATNTPLPTATPTAVPPTAVPPTAVPPTAVPPTAVPTEAPAPVTLSVDPAEQALLDAINSLRAANGLPALWPSADLFSAARQHSQDMAAASYFGHIGTDGSDPGGRMRAAGYHWTNWGEAVSRSRPGDIAGAAQAFYDSPPHHDILFSTAFTEAGVGVAYSGDGIPYWTVDVANPLTY